MIKIKINWLRGRHIEFDEPFYLILPSFLTK